MKTQRIQEWVIYSITVLVVFHSPVFAQLPTEDPPHGPLHPMLAKVIEEGPYKPQWESLVTHPVPDWFVNDKIGLSAHWGPYAVPGWTPRKDTPYGVAYAEWYWQWLKSNDAVKAHHKKFYGDAKYNDFIDGTRNLVTGDIDGFHAENFDADRWMRLFKKAGVKYFFITSKHHDGFCIWDTRYTDRNAMKMGPKRDLYGEMVDAARRHGLRIGFYYSFYEWFNPIYLGKDDLSDYKGLKKLSDEDGDGDSNEYVDDFMIPQIKELIDKYHPDYICFDGEWDHGYPYWRARQIVAYYYNQAAARGQEVVINDRFGQAKEGVSDTRGVYGDFRHVEYFANVDRAKPWAMWRGFGNSYGYNSNEHPDNILSCEAVIRMIIDCVADNGNIEFNIGPKPDGTLPAFELERLAAMGDWLAVNGEAIYGARKGVFKNLPWGRCTTKPLPKGRTRLYLHVFDWPTDGRLIVRALDNKVRNAYLLAVKQPSSLEIQRNGNDIVISVPTEAPDPIATVVVLEVEGTPVVIEPPAIVADTDAFVGEMKVRLQSKVPNSEIRYTLDGSEPVLSSPLYRWPLKIKDTATVTARLFRDGLAISTLSQRAFKEMIPLAAREVEDLKAGLVYAYYEGQWDRLPDFDSLEPKTTGIAKRVDISLCQRDEAFGFRFSGYVAVPRTGVYRFYLRSDDGSKLHIGNQCVVDNDGLHVSEEKSGLIALNEGVHPMTLVFFEKAGGQDLQVLYAGPGLKKQRIPAAALFHKAEARTEFSRVTFESLLADMTDRERLSRLPEANYTCRQFSSHDRKANEPGGETWWSNQDWSHFLYKENNQGRTEWVMMDAQGPGVVVRMWATWGKPPGIVRVYLDDAQTPLFQGPVQDVFGGNVITNAPLSARYSPRSNPPQCGNNVHLPIPYGRRCKITFEGPNPFEDPSVGWLPFYYQINYLTYEKGVEVETLSRKVLARAGESVRRVERMLSKMDRSLPAALTQRAETFRLEAGKRKTVTLTGAGAIRELTIQLKATDIEQALRSTVLEMQFDDNPTVWCPVGDFFGTGYKINPYRSWYTEVAKDGTMTCYWVMPFQKAASITLNNLGEQPVEITELSVRHGRWNWDSRSLYFHTAWKQWSMKEAKGHSGHSGVGAEDLNWVTIQGQGHYVGDSLSLFNGANRWWGEGDEKIYVDGEAFPSHFGTGTEDYYSYAWCRPEFFESPFNAQPNGSGNLRRGFSVNLRYRALDVIPFKESLQFDMELWHWADTYVNYAPTTMWYARPGCRWNVTPQIEEARMPVAVRELEIVADEDAFIDAMVIQLKSEEVKNSQIRYTLDGSEPTASSPVYRQPLNIENSTTVTARLFRDGRAISLTSQRKFKKMTFLQAEKTENLKAGLAYAYYEGDWDKLPDFDSLEPKATGVARSIDLSLSQREEKFGLRFRGYLKVPSTGIYRFYLRSDDGGKLYIGENCVVDNDGLHASTEESGMAALNEGLHPMTVVFFEKSGDQDLQVSYAGPDLEKQVIPASTLWH